MPWTPAIRKAVASNRGDIRPDGLLNSGERKGHFGGSSRGHAATAPSLAQELKTDPEKAPVPRCEQCSSAAIDTDRQREDHELTGQAGFPASAEPGSLVSFRQQSWSPKVLDVREDTGPVTASTIRLSTGAPRGDSRLVLKTDPIFVVLPDSPPIWVLLGSCCTGTSWIFSLLPGLLAGSSC